MTVVGDTRFDRVLQIREEAKDLPLVKLFKGDNTFTFVAGSSWGPDEDLFLEYFNNHPEMKLIIAPHVIDENHLDLSSQRLALVKAAQITLKNALNLLNNDEKDIVLLCAVAGFTSKECSKIIGLKPSSVRSKLSRSLAKMKNYLE